MKKLVNLIAVISFSIGALLFFHMPDFLPGENTDAIFQYSLMAFSFTYFIYSYKLKSLAYFRLPELSIPSFAGLVMVVVLTWPRITSERAITLAFWPTVSGVIYLFAIGAGEELVSRGFAFGVLRQHGRAFALIVSSIFFGAMHINLYLGADWDPFSAYWHSVSAAGFGFLMACIMIVTRSILTPIIAHGLYDWTVVFSAPRQDSSHEMQHFDSLWQTIKDTFAEVGFDVTLGLGLLAILWICRKARVPKWFTRLALKLKLIEPALHS